MNTAEPVAIAIEQIIESVGYSEHFCIIKTPDDCRDKADKIWCVIEGAEEHFLEYISAHKCETADQLPQLPPLLIVLLDHRGATSLGVFETLAESLSVRDRIYIFKYPHDTTDLLDIVRKLSEQRKKYLQADGKGDWLWPNPFRNVKEMRDNLELIKNESIKSLYGELSEIAEHRKDDNKWRLKKYHDTNSAEANIKKYISFGCCLENIYSLLDETKWLRKKILWIENNPEDSALAIPQVVFDEFFEYKITWKSKNEDIKQCFSEIEAGDAQYNDFDLILIDMFLGEDETLDGLSGKDFLSVCCQKYPAIPAFILSSSEDYEAISETIKEGADYYILKKYALSVPVYFRKSHEKLGRIIAAFKKETFKLNLIGNLRYWRFRKNLLWFGDKCYHMINHSYEHCLNDWDILNELLSPILEHEGVDTVMGGDENLYCLCMAVWLHDIGHSGNERYGAPHEIRDQHGIISGEFCLKCPDLVRIYMDDAQKKDVEALYKDIVFPFATQKKPAVQLIMENVKKGGFLSTLEKIALLCIFHKSNSPISQSDYRVLVNTQKPIPIEFYENSNKEKDIITLDSIVADLNETERNNIKLMVHILRFIDALDIRQNRVGSRDEKNMKMRIIHQDKNYLIERLRKEILSIEERYSGDERSNAINAAVLLKTFYQDVIEKIQKGESINHLELPEIAPDIAKDLYNYFMLASYASFISVQDGHFDLHSSIDKVEIKHNGKKTTDGPYYIEILFRSNLSKDKLISDKIVRDPGQKEKATICGRLIGNKDDNYKSGYILKDYLSGGDELEKFIRIGQIALISKDAKGEKDYVACISYNEAARKWGQETDLVL